MRGHFDTPPPVPSIDRANAEAIMRAFATALGVATLGASDDH